MLSETEEKLLRLAMDEGAQPGEINSAASLLIRKLRKRQVSADDLIHMLKMEAAPAPESGWLKYLFGSMEALS